ncbi:larval cuticle protein A2B-like [Episyrphus balteatus]|uniref:larval cuticle protein A2B-like n=1 Tax=Episyrphus balteatus TaxID=286459 RepID=UPI002485BA4C|nr:larval cuticle protein A2B-like [Episyrphus balteatus]XP_055848245.1 larval cuticle protein A2B-like [Episyrphus balteatus]
MAFKFIVALAFVAVASAGLIPAHQGYHAAQPVLIKSEDSYDHHPQYQFSYGVNDAHTGDVKNQIETRDGDVVKGEYSLIDADGYKRTVHYSADDVHGFNAVVQREPLGHVVKAVHSAPVAYAAPAVIKSAPLAYAAAPAIVKSAHVGYSAPAYTQNYAAAPVAYSHAPSVAYSHAPAAYTTQALVKSSRISYSAPAYAYHH